MNGYILTCTCDTNTVQEKDDEERTTPSFNAVQVLQRYSMDSLAY